MVKYGRFRLTEGLQKPVKQQLRSVFVCVCGKGDVAIQEGTAMSQKESICGKYYNFVDFSNERGREMEQQLPA